ncbi:hypothetical protein SRHO_G00199120 [Serrasalmus rhombeus]
MLSGYSRTPHHQSHSRAAPVSAGSLNPFRAHGHGEPPTDPRFVWPERDTAADHLGSARQFLTGGFGICQVGWSHQEAHVAPLSVSLVIMSHG